MVGSVPHPGHGRCLQRPPTQVREEVLRHLQQGLGGTEGDAVSHGGGGPRARACPGVTQALTWHSHFSFCSFWKAKVLVSTVEV